MFRSKVLSLNLFLATFALAATAACGGVADEGDAQLSSGDAPAIASSAEALNRDRGGRCKYRNRHTHEESYEDYSGHEHSCTPGHHDTWFEQCRDYRDETEEYACEPTNFCSHDDDWHCDNGDSSWSWGSSGCCEHHSGRGNNDGPHCLYRHNGHVSTHDYEGHERSCSPHDNWSQYCRDGHRETEEVGCECQHGYYYTNCFGNWTCIPEGAAC